MGGCGKSVAGTDCPPGVDLVLYASKPRGCDSWFLVLGGCFLCVEKPFLTCLPRRYCAARRVKRKKPPIGALQHVAWGSASRRGISSCAQMQVIRTIANPFRLQTERRSRKGANTATCLLFPLLRRGGVQHGLISVCDCLSLVLIFGANIVVVKMGMLMGGSESRTTTRISA